jgi:hypothetical protein
MHRKASERFGKSVDLHLRLEPRYVVTENDEIVLHPIAVLDVVAQQRLTAEAHALEHGEGSALIRGHLRGELFHAEGALDASSGKPDRTAAAILPHAHKMGRCRRLVPPALVGPEPIPGMRTVAKRLAL